MLSYAKGAAMAALLSLAASSANAALITLESRSYPDPGGIPAAGQYIATWDSLAPGTENSIADFSGVKTGNDRFSRLSIVFELGSVGQILFDFGLDAAWGAAAYFNGVLAAERREDLWWSNSYGNSDVLSLDLALNLGESNTLDVYWGENCCNGTQSARFSTDGGQSFEGLSTANLEAAALHH